MTNKQKLFVDYYLSNGFNATQAALSAGYSKKTSYAIGQENLNKLEIKKYLSEKVKQLLSNTEMASLEILNALDEIIRCDIGDFVEIKTILGDGEEIQKVIFNNTKDLNTKVLSEISEGQHGIKIKMHDKLKAIELKGKYLSLWADGISAIQKDSQTEKEKLSVEERRNRILELNKRLCP